MPSDDQHDRSEARRVGLLLVVLVLLTVAGAAVLLGFSSGFVATHLEPGLSLRQAAVIAFGLTVVLLIVFAIAAGDGLIGELQYMLGAFFSFFLVFWLMVAWIF